MSLKKHLIIGSVIFGLWLGFYLITLPSHYMTEWNNAEKTLLCLLTFFAIIPFIVFVVAIFLGDDYFKTGVWLAVYGSIGIFLLDFITVGMLEKKGLSFLLAYWPQTVGYLEAAVLGPLVGAVMKKGLKS